MELTALQVWQPIFKRQRLQLVSQCKWTRLTSRKIRIWISPAELSLATIRAGGYEAILVTPPCSTWSRVRSANRRGPPMVRSSLYVWGFPWLKGSLQQDVELGNVLILFMIEVLQEVASHPISAQGYLVLVLGEHPEDLGAVRREEDGAKLVPASIWQLTTLRAVLSDHPEMFTVVFGQCCFGAPYRKPTRLVTNIPQLRQWGPQDWPSFTDDGFYAAAWASCPAKVGGKKQSQKQSRANKRSLRSIKDKTSVPKGLKDPRQPLSPARGIGKLSRGQRGR